ncbi:hypothetical protein EQM14_08420 [Caproiciproducens sp. NJN-50]|uniref:hypothetical protein n=1 Tax=Acutalibacteraceae TaxID=3082771 RepID=UPI000FFE1063|nr:MULTISPECIES: hypothetical protein [Acutalibacteraceae]QAT49800.1 hypothetical protein EQM14_08420 [Caproiciproducens sp. NJN-50]
MELTEQEYENFGRCVRITNGVIDCIVSIEIGPRILRFGFVGEKNILYTDLKRKYQRPADEASAASDKNTIYYLYGGHRLQIRQSPQVDFPDNSSVVYGTPAEGVTFTAPKLKKKEVQLSYEIIMGKDASDIMIVHAAKNCSKETMLLGLSPATLLEGGGVAVIPQNQQTQSGPPSKTLNLWPDTDINDRRIFYGNRFLTVRHEPGNEKPLRIGTNNFSGWTAYAGSGFTLVKRFVANPQAAYPDSGSSGEICLTPDFVELSTLSPLYEVNPGETIKHVENLLLCRSGMVPAFSGEDEIGKWTDEILT